MGMTYSAARSLIRSGDILALTHTAWDSLYDLQIQLVRTFTQSEYSHVGLIWEIGGRLFVIEAVQPLVRMVPLSHYAEEGFFWVPLDAPITDAELMHALARVGDARYSKWQAVLAYLKRLVIGSDDLVSCAEFLIECRRRSNIDLGDVATPAEVIRYVGKPIWPVKGMQ